MTTHAQQLLEEAVKTVGLRGNFAPSRVGRRIGMDKSIAEAAARMLANAGILVLGFDNDAHFSSDYRALRAPEAPKKRLKVKTKVKSKVAVSKKA